MTMFGVVAEKVIPAATATTSDPEYTADGESDLVIEGVTLVLPRKYLIRVRSQYLFRDNGAGLTDQTWNLLFRVDGVTTDRFGRIFNNTDAVGVDSSRNPTFDFGVYYEPAATDTYDLALYLDSVGSNPDLVLQSTTKARRTMTVIDMGFAP